MLRHTNKHIKGPADNINEYLCNVNVGEKSLSKHDPKGRSHKGKDGWI